MTNQEAFNIMVTHLLTQGCRSVSEDGETCFYRSPNGLKCAVGALIPDDVYTPRMEGKEASAVFENTPALTSAELDLAFLDDVQRIHDDFNPEGWPLALSALATEYGLLRPQILKDANS